MYIKNLNSKEYLLIDTKLLREDGLTTPATSYQWCKRWRWFDGLNIAILQKNIMKGMEMVKMSKFVYDKCLENFKLTTLVILRPNEYAWNRFFGLFLLLFTHLFTLPSLSEVAGHE